MYKTVESYMLSEELFDISNLSEIEIFASEIGIEAYFDEFTLLKYSYALNGTQICPDGVMFPRNETEVSKVVKFANEHNIKLHTVSTGKNWGYSSSQGTFDGQILLNLSKMNKIVYVNEDLAYATVQPGVTQYELYRYLKNGGYNLMTDVTGAGKDTSLVGCFLERGFGHSDKGDRINSIVNLRVVLANGEIMSTGFGQFTGANAKNVYKHGVGPSFTELFSQSNFGIVTEMTIELQPKPECMKTFVVSCYKKDALPMIVEAIKELKLKNILHSSVHIANKSRAAGDSRNRFIGEWVVAGSVSGSNAIVRAKQKEVKRVIKRKVSSCQIVFVSEFRLKVINKLVDFKVIKESLIKELKYIYNLNSGIPSDEPIKILFNNKVTSDSKFAAELPDNLLWINAACSARAKDVEMLYGILKKRFDETQYQFKVTFTFINPRTLIMISDIKFPKSPKETQAANKFIKCLNSELYNKGFFPYRSGSGKYKHYKKFINPEYNKLTNSLKGAIDQNNIFSPGKYNLG